jgi:hypothetical protein
MEMVMVLKIKPKNKICSQINKVFDLNKGYVDVVDEKLLLSITQFCRTINFLKTFLPLNCVIPYQVNRQK